MPKYVEIVDLMNKELEELPIRRGCYGGPCACLGTCTNIEGYIPRNVYENFMNYQITLEELLEGYTTKYERN